uniref:Uncharacterized protein n=1 Tax=Romanomermis culicivorax TaxID=13658 RepID=A0A915JND7_ROMCU
MLLHYLLLVWNRAIENSLIWEFAQLGIAHLGIDPLVAFQGDKGTAGNDARYCPCQDARLTPAPYYPPPFYRNG